MPTNRRYRRRVRSDEFTDVKRLQLLCGHDFFGEAYGGRGEDDLDVEAARQDWEAYRESLMREHARDKGPFSRPWAWWRFEAPEPRRIVSGTAKTVGPADYFGMHRGYVYDGTIPAYESERAYLIRLDLLTAEERQVSQ